MPTPCYWLEPIRQARLTLRRYKSIERANVDTCPLMPGEYGYHNAHAPLFDVPERYEFNQTYGSKVYDHDGPQRRSEVDPSGAWPTHCACGYEFVEDDQWQVFSDHLYRRADTGEIVGLRDAPPGAMWNAEWMESRFGGRGPDGLWLMVRLPNGHDWHVDGRASNCTMPDDNEHRCWVRHGTPPTLTVDKNGHTCAAGGGSIMSGNYHGFLQGGILT